MSQSLTDIQEALDTFLTTNVTSVGTTYPLVGENTASNYEMQPDITSKMSVRTTLTPAKTTVLTCGGGQVMQSGLYVIDILAAQNTGFSTARMLGDQIMAAFKPGTIITLSNGDTLTIQVASPSTNLAFGARRMNKTYLTQIVVEYFGNTAP